MTCTIHHRVPDQAIGLCSRRDWLRVAACGFGGLAWEALQQQSVSAGSQSFLAPHFAPRAKRVIFVFMQGGPSHVDTFDYKSELLRRDGDSIDFVGVRFGTFGVKSPRKLMRPLWKFRQYGETGHYTSDLFPFLAQQVDRLCFLHGMHTEGVAHGPSTLFLHTGATSLVRPSVGAWVSYGLGTENENLPAFVTLGPAASNGGARNYANAFLSATHQATVIGRASQLPKDATIDHLVHARYNDERLARHYAYLGRLNRSQLGDDDVEGEKWAMLQSYDLAYRMQQRAPAVLDIGGETAETLSLYGIDEPETDNFGRQCLLARRLAEAGVRYIQVNYSDDSANPKWDQHSRMREHEQHARATDKPMAGLLADLRRRGLLEDTLVWWGGEFGRTPFSQNDDGRDHNPRGFTMFLAGAGVKAGYAHGATDEIGHLAVEGRVHMHDLHATLLHLLGLDHKRLTYPYAGRDFRLTDVHGRVVQEILA